MVSRTRHAPAEDSRIIRRLSDLRGQLRAALGTESGALRRAVSAPPRESALLQERIARLEHKLEALREKLGAEERARARLEGILETAEKIETNNGRVLDRLEDRCKELQNRLREKERMERSLAFELGQAQERARHARAALEAAGRDRAEVSGLDRDGRVRA